MEMAIRLLKDKFRRLTFLEMYNIQSDALYHRKIWFISNSKRLRSP